MLKVGNFYMHTKAMDVCVQIMEDLGSGTYTVQWWNLGSVGTPWPVPADEQQIYMHPDVWTDITEQMTLPRLQWKS